MRLWTNPYKCVNNYSSLNFPRSWVQVGGHKVAQAHEKMTKCHGLYQKTKHKALFLMNLTIVVLDVVAVSLNHTLLTTPVS